MNLLQSAKCHNNQISKQGLLTEIENPNLFALFTAF